MFLVKSFQKTESIEKTVHGQVKESEQFILIALIEDRSLLPNFQKSFVF